MPSINTYISAKKVGNVPEHVQTLCTGTAAAGVEFAIGLIVDPMYPALIVASHTRDNQPVTLRLGLPRLVDSLIGAEAAETDRWEPLTETEPGRWGNTALTVHVQQHGNGVIHISYHRRDRAPIRDWRIGQRLKNQLAGEEWEGLELYPAESRKVDTSNEYHIWCVPQLPFGFEDGDLLTQNQIDTSPHPDAIQRDNPDDAARLSDPQDVNWTSKVRVPRKEATDGDDRT